MRNIQSRQAFCGLFLVLFLAGCSGSNEILDGSHGRPVTDEVTSALELVILPAIEMLAAFSPVNQPAPPRSMTREPGVQDCAHFDPLCRSGGYEVCRAGREGLVVFRFERCARSAGLLDGSWELTQDGLQAAAEFDLSLDDLALSGRIAYVLDDMCWQTNFDSFSATRQAYSATLEGSVGYCFATGAGSGQLRISVVGPSGPFDMLLELDAGGGSAVVLRDEVNTVCRFELGDGVANCETD